MKNVTEAEAGERLRRLVDALDDEPPTDEEAREVVAALGVDIPALAARIRARAIAATHSRGERLRLAHDAAHGRRVPREQEPIRPRDEQLARIRALLARAPESTIAANFRKLEEAGDEELAAIVTSLRDLVEPPDGDPEA